LVSNIHRQFIQVSYASGIINKYHRISLDLADYPEIVYKLYACPIGGKMSNYVLLYNGGGMPTSEIERKRILDDWTAWYKKLDNAIVDQGNPFTPMAKSISIDGKIHDGADCPTVTGYTIIKAMSLDAAVQIARNCPALKYGSKISIYETFNAMG
jgi:hypothetical protein